jgi:hypothetical protein
VGATDSAILTRTAYCIAVFQLIGSIATSRGCGAQNRSYL